MPTTSPPETSLWTAARTAPRGGQQRSLGESRWHARKFGTGAGSQRAFGDPWASAFRIGPHQELLGDRVRRAVPPSDSVRGELVVNARRLDDVDPRGRIVPTRLVGRIEGSQPGAVRDLAVAVNGRVWAVGRSFRLRGRPRELFSLIFPERALRRGNNRLQLLEVERDGGLVSLLEI